MMSMKNNMDIIPGVGLGGIFVGNTVEDLNINNDELKLVNSQLIASIEGGAIFLVFSQENQVVQISACNGYKGKLLNKYAVGDPIIALVENASWSFSVSDDGFVSDEFNGVVIHPNLDDATEAEIYANRHVLTIESISIF